MQVGRIQALAFKGSRPPPGGPYFVKSKMAG